MARIVTFPPVILTPVHLYVTIIVEISFRGIPFCFIFFESTISADFRQSLWNSIVCKAHHLFFCPAARISRVFLPERKYDTVDRTRFLPNQSGKVYWIVFPSVYIFCAVLTQPQCVLVNQSSGTAQFTGGWKRIGLHEHQYIVFKNTDHA